MTDPSVASPSDPPCGEAAWQAYRQLVDRLDPASRRQLFREIENQIVDENPDLMELGSSDIACHGVNFLERGLLISRPNGYSWC